MLASEPVKLMGPWIKLATPYADVKRGASFYAKHQGEEMLGKTSVLLCAVVFTLAGCATQKEMLVTGASRADGTITLAYESNEFQRVSVDAQKAEDMAAQRCKAWGYDGAESFGSQQTECLSRRGFGNCGSRRVSVVYQCTGSPGQR